MMETDKDGSRSTVRSRTTRTSGISSWARLRNVNEKYFKGKHADVERLRRASQLRRLLAAQALRPYLKRVTVPTLHVAGWWDQEDFYGPLTIYEISRSTTRTIRTSSSSGRGITAAGSARAANARQHRLRRARPGSTFAPRSRPLLRALPQGQGDARSARSAHLRGREQWVEALRLLAAQGRRRDQEAVLPANGKLSLDPPPATQHASRTTSSSRIRRSRCRTASGRSSRRTIHAARRGTRGSSTTSASSTTGPMS